METTPTDQEKTAREGAAGTTPLDRQSLKDIFREVIRESPGLIKEMIQEDPSLLVQDKDGPSGSAKDPAGEYSHRGGHTCWSFGLLGPGGCQPSYI